MRTCTLNYLPEKMLTIIDSKYHVRGNTVENVANIIRIPKKGRQRYMGAVQRLESAQTISIIGSSTNCQF